MSDEWVGFAIALPPFRRGGRGGYVCVWAFPWLPSLTLLLSAFLVFVCGCGNPELQEAQRQAAACRLELEALKEAQSGEQDDCGSCKAQRDRLAAQCADLKAQMAHLELKAKGADNTAAAGELAAARLQIEEQRRELETALAAIRRSRDEWEQALADRQRQIDVLTNQVERLKRELDAASGGSRPSR